MTATERRNTAKHIVGERRKSDVQHVVDALRTRGRVVLKTYGSSMQPWVRPGDISVVHKTSTESSRLASGKFLPRETRILSPTVGLRTGNCSAE